MPRCWNKWFVSRSGSGFCCFSSVIVCCLGTLAGVEQVLEIVATRVSDESCPNIPAVLPEFGVAACTVQDAGWTYCCVLMETLVNLCRAVDNLSCGDNPVPVLSIQQEKTVSNCLQLTVALGLLPNLLCGVGIPIDRRSKHHSLLTGLTPSHLEEEQVEF